MKRPSGPRPALAAAILCLVLLGVALALWTTPTGEPGASPRDARAHPRRAAPPLEALPARPGDPALIARAPIAGEAARRLNAAIPFAQARPEPARPFRFAGTAPDRARAIDCLALAALAEAGGGEDGQRAVMQVVLNRVRHPAFARTVCGVVFQGAERASGCQFTFTCDGSLARRYGEAAWAAARARAAEALDGRVFAPLGTATHYHTDWVHPYWSSQLTKIARVQTHLFFRWPGFWGSRDAARMPYRGGEPAIAALAWLPSHAAAVQDARALASGAAAGFAPIAPEAAAGQPGLAGFSHESGGAHLLHLASAPAPAAALSLGRRLCGGEGYCRVMAWTEAGAVPRGLPVPPASRAALSFSYARDANGAEYVFYDCRVFAGVPRDKCLPPARQ